MSETKEWGTFLGRDLGYADDKKEIYEKLQEHSFKNKNFADIFFYAAVLGFKNRQAVKLKERMPNIPVQAFTDKQKATLLALVIADTNDVNILFDEKTAVTKIEEFANWGIGELEAIVSPARLGSDNRLMQLKRIIMDFNG